MFMFKKNQKQHKPPQKTTENPQTQTRPALSHPKSPTWTENWIFTVCSQESERSLFSLLYFIAPLLPHTCYIVMIIISTLMIIKFCFSSYLQRDFSTCKPEQLKPPPWLPSWPWTRSSLCQSCFLVCFGHGPQMLWAGSESGHFCLIWLWHCWWIPGK